MHILLPNSIELTLPHDVTHTYTTYDVTAPFTSAHASAEVLVAWGNTPANLRSAVMELPHLRLVQTLAAGPDAVLAAGFAAKVAICSGRSLHDGPVAEHALALILQLLRNQAGLLEAQRRHVWDEVMVRAQAAPATRGLYTLNEATVVILGYGSIARRLTPLLQGLGATVIGVATSAGERYGHPVIAMADVAQVVPQADVVLSILPATAETEKIVNQAFFTHMKKTAIFVNVGRGKTVDEIALAAALRNSVIRAAAIDVTAIEPLPAESSLWDCPNLIITPHVAGNRPLGASALVQAQIQALQTGSALRNVVQR
jgi:phosphoglycerate dehydrogenase-like enzyme